MHKQFLLRAKPLSSGDQRQDIESIFHVPEITAYLFISYRFEDRKFRPDSNE